MIDGDGLAADEGADAARQEVAGQGCDEGRNLQAMDGSALEQAQAHADDQREQDAPQGMDPQNGVAVGDEHAGEGGDGRDGVVDAAGDEHHRHADCGDAVVGVVDEHVHKGAQGGEALGAVGDCAHRVNQQEDADGGIHHDVLGVGNALCEALLSVARLLDGSGIRHSARLLSPWPWPWNASRTSCAPVRTGAR